MDAPLPYRSEVGLLLGARVERVEVVHPNDGLPRGDQRLNHVGTYEAGGAGDENAPHEPTPYG